MVGRRLSRAGVQCRLRKNPVARGLFGVAPLPELWIENERDIPRVFRVLGAKRLRQMTVILPTV